MKSVWSEIKSSVKESLRTFSRGKHHKLIININKIIQINNKYNQI